MRKVLHLLTFAFTLATISISASQAKPVVVGYVTQPAPTGKLVCGAMSQNDKQEALALTNKFRASHNVRGLTLDPRLMQIAEQQACHMAKTGQVSHTGAGGGSPKSRAHAAGYRMSIIAENAARGFTTVDQTVAGWHVSPGHKKNELLPSTVQFGVGTAIGPDGRQYWTAVYAAPMVQAKTKSASSKSTWGGAY